MIDKTYQPSEVETRIYAEWEQAGAFRAGRPERAQALPYSIVIPPPNVTGSLHMGHALNNTLQDILARFERMRGKDVLWQPGTDHAGIATQMVVERQLMERQEPSRRDMGRAKFLERVWAWKAESGGTITRQLKRLGASCDWSRERFTMDEGLSRAVLKVFVALYNEGLIYKDKRLVNWDPKLLTAISDLEVQQVEVKGHLWHIKYPIEGSDQFIVVATTRPETMLGDVAVAVHPENEKLKHLIGKNAILPLVGRKIPIIGDDYADPEKGTGAVKITPAHDFNDFEVGKRHNLPQISVLDAEGKITLGTVIRESLPQSPELEETKKLQGIDRFKARKMIVERLEVLGLLDKVEPHTHAVPHGDRSNVVIEPFLTDQWYVDAKTLAQPAIAAVRDGRTNFVPKNWEKTYFDWMENIQPWCISRQLWWGHQIPVWYGVAVDKEGYKVDGPYKEFVAETAEAALAEAKLYYGPDVKVAVDLNPISDSRQVSNGQWKVETVGIGRDEDVLDTWFSSALWPFSTLGWPDETNELKRFYPTSVLVTGFDIIFFWVARMMMMGLHFMKEIPFHDVYIHALVRDEKGAKMSKSKGNVIDPLAIIDDYGADALRFTLAAMAAQGRDIKLSPQRVEGYRNFATKLWNAARFAEMNGALTVPNFNPNAVKQTVNRWIVHETRRAVVEVTEALCAYRFNDAANAAYRFVWNIYCDWYLELTKPVLSGIRGSAWAETSATVCWVRDEILKVLHPFMPFITEELWRVTAPRDELLVLSRWPISYRFQDRGRGVSWTRFISGLRNAAFKRGVDVGGEFSAVAEIGFIVGLIEEIRSSRREFDIPGGAVALVRAINFKSSHKRLIAKYHKEIFRLSRSLVNPFHSKLVISDDPDIPENVVIEARNQEFLDHVILPYREGQLLLHGIDRESQRAKYAREMQKAEADIQRVDAKLNNPKFVANAAEEVVDGEREKREEAETRRQKIVEALERLKSAK